MKVHVLLQYMIMGGKLYEPEGQIERASCEQTYLVHGRSRRCGLTMTAHSLCSAEIASSENLFLW